MNEITWEQQSEKIYQAWDGDYLLQVVHTPNTNTWRWWITQGKKIIEDSAVYKACETPERAMEQCMTAHRIEMIRLENAPKVPEGGAFVLFTSNRSRDNALRVIGNPKPQAYSSFHRETGQGVYMLDAQQLASIHGMKGWRKIRGPYSDLMQCWS